MFATTTVSFGPNDHNEQRHKHEAEAEACRRLDGCRESGEAQDGDRVGRVHFTLLPERSVQATPPGSGRLARSPVSCQDMEVVNELMVRGIVVGVFQENCWVVGNRRTGEAICIDPGDQPDEVLALARDMGVTIKYIANSHAHIDHVLGVLWRAIGHRRPVPFARS